MIRGLSLPGGSAKGAREVGAMLALSELGWVPDIIAGTSIGGLHAGFIADRLGQGMDFHAAVRELDLLWTYSLRENAGPLVEERSKLSLVWDIVHGKWKYVLDASFLHAMIDEHIQEFNTRRCPIPVVVSAVDVSTGAFRYFRNTDSFFMDGVHSTMVMPLTFEGWDGASHPNFFGWDGGMVDVAPIDPLVQAQADEIVVIPNHPRVLRFNTEPFDSGSLKELLSRLSMIITHNTLIDDLKHIEQINWVVEHWQPNDEFSQRWKHIKTRVIWPPGMPKIELETMALADYIRVRSEGRQTTLEEMAKPW